MRRLMAAVLISFASFNASAALVDNGTFTTDTDSGLDWLDLTFTDGDSYAGALATNPGWRHATYAEVSNLFSVAFDGFVDTSGSNGGLYSRSDAVGADPDMSTDANAWISLFGATEDIAGVADASGGFYFDDSNTYRSISVVYVPGNGFSEVGFDNFGVNFASEAISGNDAVGVFMVRSTIVPIPAAAWLFGSALIGLGWVRRKQTA